MNRVLLKALRAAMRLQQQIIDLAEASKGTVSDLNLRITLEQMQSDVMIIQTLINGRQIRSTPALKDADHSPE